VTGQSEPAIVVEDVSKRFRLYKERNESVKAALMRGRRARYDEFWALRGVSLQIPVGATYGLMGVNGSGKSTLLKCIANILRPDTGSISYTGKMAALLELGSGFHPELSGRENVYLNGSILGLSKRELDARFDEIVDFAGVEKFIDQPVKNYSSGMYVRLGFSVAINVDPDILLVDEVLAVGDAAFQEKCSKKFAEFKKNGKTVVIVSHAMASLRQMCDEVAWLASGRVDAVGKPGAIIDRYIDEGHQAVAAEGGGRRWGSGEAQIVKVTMLDASGEVTNQVKTGAPLTIRFEIVADEPVELPVFGITITTVEGTEVWSQNTRDTDFAMDKILGPHVVEWTVPSFKLLPGSYNINASLRDVSRTHVYDFHRDCYPFFVETGKIVERGLVSLGGTWREAGVPASR